MKLSIFFDKHGIYIAFLSLSYVWIILFWSTNNILSSDRKQTADQALAILKCDVKWCTATAQSKFRHKLAAAKIELLLHFLILSEAAHYYNNIIEYISFVCKTNNKEYIIMVFGKVLQYLPFIQKDTSNSNILYLPRGSDIIWCMQGGQEHDCT